MAGYSGTPLLEKLGLNPDHQFKIVNSPAKYLEELNIQNSKATQKLDFIQYFTHSKSDLEKNFPSLKAKLLKTGMLWISWPKGSSGVKTDLNENLIREIGLKNGLVDVKVVAVDETYSGLKFIYRLKDR